VTSAILGEKELAGKYLNGINTQRSIANLLERSAN
jgi:hypothetical protein